MKTVKGKICVTLPGAPAYSETFLQAHIDRLGTSVNYLSDFPVDVYDLFPKSISSDGAERIKREVRFSWHRYVLNPMKKSALRKFFKRNNSKYSSGGIRLDGSRCFKRLQRV